MDRRFSGWGRAKATERRMAEPLLVPWIPRRLECRCAILRGNVILHPGESWGGTDEGQGRGCRSAKADGYFTKSLKDNEICWSSRYLRRVVAIAGPCHAVNISLNGRGERQLRVP